MPMFLVLHVVEVFVSIVLPPGENIACIIHLLLAIVFLPLIGALD